MFKKLYNLVNTIHLDPFTFKKAVLLWFFVEGLMFTGQWLFSLVNLDYGIIPDLILLLVTLFAARIIGKDELPKILVWHYVPLKIFFALLVMFSGLIIIKSELLNMLLILIPVPDNLSDWLFNMPDNVFLAVLSGALFPGFSEEILCRGIIAGRFSRVYTPIKTVLLSSLIFAAIHINPWQFLNAFIAGIFFGWIYLRYKSIWLCMFLHAYNNIIGLFAPIPFVLVDGSSDAWRHPFWFDVIGGILFGIGLFNVIVSGWKDKTRY